MNTLGDHIRKRRLVLGLFQKDAARIIVIDQTTIYNWGNNRFQPHSRFISKIISFLRYCSCQKGKDPSNFSLSQTFFPVSRYLVVFVPESGRFGLKNFWLPASDANVFDTITLPFLVYRCGTDFRCAVRLPTFPVI